MKIIFLTRDLPYPATSGYKKRNFYLLKELTDRKVDVVLFCEDSLLQPPQFLKDYCKEIRIIKARKKIYKAIVAFLSLFSSLPFSVKIRISPKIKREIEAYIRKNGVDIIICDSVYRSLNIPSEFKGYKILLEHNIESLIVKRYLQNERNIFKKVFAFIEYLKLERFQKKMWKEFHCCIACSSLDKKIMEEKTGKSDIFVINNGVDINYFKQNSYSICKNVLVFTGEIGWYPNEDAITYFVKDIFPLIKKEEPELTFWIVGRNPSSRIKDLAKRDNSIIVTGFVDDVREFIGKACVYVVPLRIGGGTRLKILEALSMKKPVVSTSIGCEGLKVEDNKHILIEDEPEQFAKAVLTLLNHEDLRNSLGDNGRRLVEENYDWQKVFKDFGQILQAISSTLKG